MSEATDIARITAFAGFGGVLIGAVISGFFAYKISEVQLKQAVMTTAATSSLSLRSTLAKKASSFFLANQSFLIEITSGSSNADKIRTTVVDLDKARSGLSPYLDADLLIACEDVADNARILISPVSSSDRAKALELYEQSYKSFQILYLRLRRELEANAQVNVVNSQIADEYKHPRIISN